MKAITALGLLAYGGAALAQSNFTSGSVPGTISGFGNAAFPAFQAPQIADFGLNNGDTPTTIRQRERRAKLILAAFPELKQELMGMSRYAAQKRFEKARRQWLWSNDRANVTQQ